MFDLGGELRLADSESRLRSMERPRSPGRILDLCEQVIAAIGRHSPGTNILAYMVTVAPNGKATLPFGSAHLPRCRLAPAYWFSDKRKEGGHNS
jgi:hypothetical protein